MLPKNETDTKESRSNIIQTVQTPLGFFVLVVLVVEVVLGFTATFTQGPDRTYLVIGMMSLVFLLVGIVAFFAWQKPASLGAITRSESTTVDVSASVPTVERVGAVSVLCACAPSLSGVSWEFQRDVEVLQREFPKRLVVEDNVTSDRLRELLTSREFNIVHYVGYVDPKDGDLVFGQEDRLSADGFAKLLEVCKARLVVLATCDSIALAAKVSRISNIIAAISFMEIKDCVDWESVFYKLLSKGQPLSRSYEIARATCNAPMVLLLKQDYTFAKGV